MEWPAHPLLVGGGGGGGSVWYQSISIGNHACSNLKYIHIE